MSLKTLIKEASFLARSLIFQQSSLLLIVFSLTSLLNITLQDALANLDPSQENQRWMIQVSLGIWDLLAGMVTLMLLVSATANLKKLQEPPLLAHPLAQPFFISYLAESLRSMANVLLWSLVFVIPGFVKYCRFVFVPFIALFSSEYRAGKVDALELSSRLTQGRMKTIVGLVLTTGAIDFALEILPHLSSTLHGLFFRLAFDALSFLLAIWNFSFLFLLFDEALTKETSVPTTPAT